jgi:hypothetical protein
MSDRLIANSLGKDEAFLLEWLSKEDVSLYGECSGSALNSLINRGMATVKPSGRAKEYDGVSLTELGHRIALVTVLAATERPDAEPTPDAPR